MKVSTSDGFEGAILKISSVIKFPKFIYDSVISEAEKVKISINIDNFFDEFIPYTHRKGSLNGKILVQRSEKGNFCKHKTISFHSKNERYH